MLSNFNNSLNNKKIDLNSQNYSDKKLTDSNNSQQKFSANLFENGSKEQFSTDNLFTSKASKSSSSSESSPNKYPYENRGTFSLPEQVYDECKQEAVENNFEKAGYKFEDLADAFANDANKWQEIMNDVIDKRTDLSEAEKAEKRHQLINLYKIQIKNIRA